MKTTTFLRLLASAALLLVITLPAAGQGQAPNKVDVLIGFVSPPTPEDVDVVRAVGGQVRFRYSIVPAIAASVPEPALRGLARDHRVRYIEEDTPVYATIQTIPWGVQRVFGDSEDYPFGAWDINQLPAGQTIKVAVLDTGISLNHRDLAVAGGWNYWGGEPADGHGHGTHVAGTIAALNNTEDVVGVSPQVSLYAVKVLYDNGVGSVSSIVAGIDWAVAQGMDIINMSLGSPDPSQTMEMAMNNAYAGGSGILLIASAGNEGNSTGTGDTVGYPAKYESVIAVAASDANYVRASFSSTGPAVEITAPGVNILSTYPPYTDTFGPPQRRQTYYTATMSGTSMAAPHVAGVAALVMAAKPDLRAGEVRQILQATASDLGTSGIDAWYGHGLVNATEAVEAASSPLDTPPSAPTGLAAAPGDALVNLTWNVSRGATGYNVYRKTAEDTAGTPIASGLTDASHVDRGLVNGTSYSYVVRAVNAAGESAASNEVTAMPRAATDRPTVVYVGADTVTRGTWNETYGTEGYYVYRQPIYDEPATGHTYTSGWGDQVALLGALPAVWDDPSTDPRALQAPGALDRFAACHFHNLGFAVEINLSRKSRVSLYFLDWDTQDRRQNIVISDAYDPSVVLHTQALSSSFNGGVYLTWEIEGHVRIDIVRTAGANAVLSGIFFDSATSDPPPSNADPVADFTYSATDLSVAFTDTSTDTDGTIRSWNWSFGDGATSTAQDPTHTYSIAGTYTVSLTVTDDDGAPDTKAQQVAVSTGTGEPLPLDSALSGSTARVNRNFWTATATVTVTSGGLPVPGATVQGTWSGGISGAVSGQTGTDGTISFSAGNLRNQVTTVIFTLTAVSKDGYTPEAPGRSVTLTQP